MQDVAAQHFGTSVKFNIIIAMKCVYVFFVVFPRPIICKIYRLPWKTKFDLIRFECKCNVQTMEINGRLRSICHIYCDFVGAPVSPKALNAESTLLPCYFIIYTFHIKANRAFHWLCLLWINHFIINICLMNANATDSQILNFIFLRCIRSHIFEYNIKSLFKGFDIWWVLHKWIHNNNDTKELFNLILNENANNPHIVRIIANLK